MGINVLHIAVHLGGGVGTVVKNWIDRDLENNHTVLLLNKNYYGSDPHYIHDLMRGKDDGIKEWIQKSDVVVIHFWNHPYLFEFLVNFQFPPCRICVWSHVSGLNPPYVHLEKLARLADKFVLSSPISLSGDIQHFNPDLLDKISVIWTTGGIEDYLKIDRNEKKGFTIGYIGTLDYCKLSPNFVSLCEAVLKRIPEAKFVVCGVGQDEEKIKNEVSFRGMDGAFSFMGMCLNIEEIIPTFSVFGYPLNEKHFGTCEQVLGEVMAVGIMPVVLDNPSEKYIVASVAKVSGDFAEYVENIVQLYLNPINNEDVLSLKERAKELYDMDTMICSWNKMFSEVMVSDKRERSWDKDSNTYGGYEIFLESIGKYADIIKTEDSDEIRKLFKSNDQWLSKNKGSIYQYVSAFSDEELLKLSHIAESLIK
jgi:glycosyltransferase involved in cell wall biosynthesis